MNPAICDLCDLRGLKAKSKIKSANTVECLRCGITNIEFHLCKRCVKWISECKMPHHSYCVDCVFHQIQVDRQVTHKRRDFPDDICDCDERKDLRGMQVVSPMFDSSPPVVVCTNVDKDCCAIVLVWCAVMLVMWFLCSCIDWMCIRWCTKKKARRGVPIAEGREGAAVVNAEEIELVQEGRESAPHPNASLSV